VDLVGRDVEVGVGPGDGIELHGRHGPEGALTWRAGTVGEVQCDAVVVDADHGGAFGGLVLGQIGKCHARQH